MKYFIFFLISCTVLCSSCTPFQVVLKESDSVAKYKMADSLYQVAMATGKKAKFRSSLKLMEQIVPLYRGKPQAEKLSYIYANTFYNLEDYFVAGYQFERFESTYPKSDSVEVAAYKSAKSYYELSPRSSLDQKDTEKGLEKLQAFVNKYPNSSYRIEANNLVSELREKLEKKDIDTAKAVQGVLADDIKDQEGDYFRGEGEGSDRNSSGEGTSHRSRVHLST